MRSIAGWCTTSNIRCTQSRRRTRSRSSDSIPNSTTGSTCGSLDARRTSPAENTRITAPMSRAPTSPSSVGPVAPNAIICMSFGPALDEARRVAQHRRQHRCVGTDHAALRYAARPRSRASRRGLSRFAPTGNPSSTPTPDRSRIAGEWIAPALTITARAVDRLAVRRQHTDRAPTVEDARGRRARRRVRAGSGAHERARGTHRSSTHAGRRAA